MKTDRALGILALVVMLSGTAGCGAGSSTPSATGNPTASTTSVGPSASSATSAGTATGSAPAASATAITIKDFAFQIPAGLKAGSTVTITNGDSAPHTFTDKAGSFDVKVAADNGTGTLTVPAAGTYEIICKIHAKMGGTLTVA